MSAPYYADGSVSLHLGDCREVLPTLNIAPDAAICDPPYGYTSTRVGQRLDQGVLPFGEESA